jgi:NAD(P)-dependent dehydrogenase (short-subunit alcohol dehydrogenase family)
MVTTNRFVELTGRVALITGASSGLGAGFARRLARDGARVVLAARRLDRLVDLKAEIEAEGGQALAVEMDVSSQSSVISAYDAIEREFGLVDTVVANAGINVEGRSVDLSVEDFEQLMAVNVRGTFLTVREAGRRWAGDRPEAARLRAEERGRVVMIASIGAHTVLPGLTSYCGSKAAVMEMGRGFAREWARQGVSVNVVCPGYIETDINAHWWGSAGGQKQLVGFPRRRLAEASDLQAMVAMLCSDTARTITGSVFTVDDGQTL